MIILIVLPFQLLLSHNIFQNHFFLFRKWYVSEPRPLPCLTGFWNPVCYGRNSGPRHTFFLLPSRTIQDFEILYCTGGSSMPHAIPEPWICSRDTRTYNREFWTKSPKVDFLTGARKTSRTATGMRDIQTDGQTGFSNGAPDPPHTRLPPGCR